MSEEPPVANYRLTIQLKKYHNHAVHVILADGADFTASNKVANIIYRLLMSMLFAVIARFWHFGPEPTEEELTAPPEQGSILAVDL